ncbi:hypothetical protein, conserved [Plasmodium gonderi]|uniref:Uncharacterized protein n=1 Tax=Plasmodium gonderi TaxID=77519 RepID=A0A1Y1JQV9_PLAGO|nr:hypothetical protein, conserved [Plasmodium gonderi]GAW82863.1 hypothetical protein, conserved [Plasmodium gonderi]
MHAESRQVNATMRKCTEMEYMCRLYSIQLIEQRERINKIKKKLNSYNQNIQEQENILSHLTKYTGGFLNNVMTFVENFTNSKRLGMLGSCARYCLVDDRNEINVKEGRKSKGAKRDKNGMNMLNGTTNCHCNCRYKQINSKKCVSNQCQNTIVYNKTSFYVEENANRKKNKKSKSKLKKGLKKKYLQLTENIYNLHKPYDTVEVKDLYDIYRKQKSTYCDHYYIN